MQLVNHSNQRGDTIIEVLLAISIFSLVAVGGFSIMNKGSAVAQRALEISLVRQQIDAQAETLRFLNASYIAAFDPDISLGSTYLASTGYDSGSPEDQWATMVSDIIVANNTTVSKFSNIASAGCTALAPQYSFILNPKTAKYIKSSSMSFRDSASFSQIRYRPTDIKVIENTDGIWVEAVRMLDTGLGPTKWGYIDFHIRACWSSIGQALPATIGTIVRLYEPR